MTIPEPSESLARLAGAEDAPAPELAPAEPQEPEQRSLRDSIDAVVRLELIRALAACGGNQTHAARRLGISRRAVIYLMEQHGLKERPPSWDDPGARVRRKITSVGHAPNFRGETR